MARIVKTKELKNTRLATNYGGWTYCDTCGANIGYLCYSTYDKINFNYSCACGSKGSMLIDFADSGCGKLTSDEMILVKSRLCCSGDNEPLLTILEEKLLSYELEITCKSSGKIYVKKK